MSYFFLTELVSSQDDFTIRIRTGGVIDMRQAIQKARTEKKMSQAYPAKLINERAQVVAEYANDKAVANQLVLG